MSNLPSSLGKWFIVAGFVPALIFVVLTWLFILPGMAPPTLDTTLLQLNVEEGAGFIIIPSIIGIVLLALNTSIIRLFEGNYRFERQYLLRRQLERNKARHSRLYKDLNTFKEALDAEEDPFKRRSLLRAIRREHSKIFSQDDVAELPRDAQRIAPTQLGNVFTVVEEYPHRRYGMDGVTFWPRLLTVISNGHREAISDEKTTLDFLLNLSFLSIVFGIGTLVTFAIRISSSLRTWPLLILTAGAWLAAFGLYRGAVTAAVNLGELIKSCFDLFRSELLEKLGFEPPDDIDEEKKLWTGLTNYLISGEVLYYPGPAKEESRQPQAPEPQQSGPR